MNVILTCVEQLNSTLPKERRGLCFDVSVALQKLLLSHGVKSELWGAEQSAIYHWFVVTEDGLLLDLTATQFGEPVTTRKWLGNQEDHWFWGGKGCQELMTYADHVATCED